MSASTTRFVTHCLLFLFLSSTQRHFGWESIPFIPSSARVILTMDAYAFCPCVHKTAMCCCKKVDISRHPFALMLQGYFTHKDHLDICFLLPVSRQLTHRPFLLAWVHARLPYYTHVYMYKYDFSHTCSIFTLDTHAHDMATNLYSPL